MNSLTVYALGRELSTVLSGSTLTGALRFRGGATLSFDSSQLPYLHILMSGREAGLFPAHEAFAPEECTVPAFSPVHGAVVESIHSLGFDRVLVFEATCADRWGKSRSYVIRIDLGSTRRLVSLFQSRENRLLDSFGTTGGWRPSSASEQAPPRRFSLVTLDAQPPDELRREFSRPARPDEAAEHTLAWERVRRCASILLDYIDGLDPILARMLSKRTEGNIENAWTCMLQMADRLRSGSFSWHLYDFPEEGEAGYGVLYPIELPLEGNPAPLKHCMEALLKRAYRITIPSYTESLSSKLVSSVKKNLVKMKRLDDNLSDDLRQAERSQELRHFGNLLLTYRHLMRPGMKAIRVRDFSGDRTIEIPLSPSMSRDENIRSYFVKAKKGEKGLLIIRNRRREIRREIDRIEREISRIENLRSPLEILRLIPREKTARVRVLDDRSRHFRSFVLDKHHTVYVGRNDSENDLLTHRFAAPSDMWFHAQSVTGSHVILKGANPSTPARILETAAAVAAYFSRARHSTTVPVIYTEKRYVRKPRGSRAGTAVCQREKTIFVRPSLPGEGDR